MLIALVFCLSHAYASFHIRAVSLPPKKTPMAGEDNWGKRPAPEEFGGSRPPNRQHLRDLGRALYQ